VTHEAKDDERHEPAASAAISSSTSPIGAHDPDERPVFFSPVQLLRFAALAGGIGLGLAVAINDLRLARPRRALAFFVFGLSLDVVVVVAATLIAEPRLLFLAGARLIAVCAALVPWKLQAPEIGEWLERGTGELAANLSLRILGPAAFFVWIVFFVFALAAIDGPGVRVKRASARAAVYVGCDADEKRAADLAFILERSLGTQVKAVAYDKCLWRGYQGRMRVLVDDTAAASERAEIARDAMKASSHEAVPQILICSGHWRCTDVIAARAAE
jgi:hypothetical protein